MCAKICAQTSRGGSTRLVSPRVTLTTLRSLVKLGRPSRDFRAVCQQFVAAKSDGLPYSLKKAESSLQRHPWVYDSATPSVRAIGKLLSQIQKSCHSTCATNFQQTKISPRQLTHSACPSTQFMIIQRKHIQKLAKEASDSARQAFATV